MADKDTDDYHFPDLDSSENLSMGEEEETPTQKESPTTPKSPLDIPPHVKRNALILVAVCVVGYLGYSLVSHFISKKVPTKTSTVAVKPVPVALVPTPAHIDPVASPPPQEAELTQRVSNLESNQQNLKIEVSRLGEQISDLSNSVKSISDQVDKLNVMVTKLTSEIVILSNRNSVMVKPVRIKPVVRRPLRPAGPRLKYDIQAVIPGRAWIIATNGSTLTVRVGTKIAGYGVVTFIDPLQGRVLTSSGKRILFSQKDS